MKNTQSQTARIKSSSPPFSKRTKKSPVRGFGSAHHRTPKPTQSPENPPQRSETHRNKNHGCLSLCCFVFNDDKESVLCVLEKLPGSRFWQRSDCVSPSVWSSRSSGTSGLPLRAEPFPQEHTAFLQPVVCHRFTFKLDSVACVKSQFCLAVMVVNINPASHHVSVD